MEKIKNAALVVALAGVAVLGFVVSSQSSPSVESVADTVSKKLGALVGPIIPYSYFGFGDVVKYAAHNTLNQASTTVCALQAPAATSTLRLGNIGITTGTTSAVVIDIGKGSTPTATTTLLGTTFTLAASELATIHASTTDSNTSTFGPNQWIVFKYGGVNGALNTFVGSCNAEWQVI